MLQSFPKGMAPADRANLERAANLLKESAEILPQTPESAYVLAMANKRLGRFAEARLLLQKCDQSNSGVHLQLGILSALEDRFPDAEKEFRSALAADPKDYAANYNLMLLKLCHGNIPQALAFCSDALANAPSDDEASFLRDLSNLLTTAHNVPPLQPRMNSSPNGDDVHTAVGSHRQHGLSSYRGGGHLQRLLSIIDLLPDARHALAMLKRLYEHSPSNADVRIGYVERGLIEAKQLLDRCYWNEALAMLATLESVVDGSDAQQTLPVEVRIGYLTMRGVCLCLLQDFGPALDSFAAAMALAPNDVHLQQNIALINEFLNRHDAAESAWHRLCDLLEPAALEDRTGQQIRRISSILSRLADTCVRHERWHSAMRAMRRLMQLRPNEFDIVERLYQICVQLHKLDDARRYLRQMKSIRPHDPLLDLYEFDLREFRTLEDREKMVNELKRLLDRHPASPQFDERAATLVATCISMIARRCDQFSERLVHVVDQVRTLPNYQINWPAVHDEMYYLQREFQKLRRFARKCLAVAITADNQKHLRELIQHIEAKIEVCTSMGA